jgi:hypothetical protein
MLEGTYSILICIVTADLPGETEEKSRNSSERHPVFRSNFNLSPPNRGVSGPDHVAVLFTILSQLYRMVYV